MSTTIVALLFAALVWLSSSNVAAASCKSGQVLLPSDVNVVLPQNPSTRFIRIATLLTERIMTKSQYSWRLTNDWSTDTPASFAVFLAVQPSDPKHIVKERYRISSTLNAVYITGDDDLGLIFGVGRFLRLLSAGWTQNYSSPLERFICIPSHIFIDSIPQYPIRGHQIAYRALSDSYAGWSYNQMESYIEDLIIYGTNTIEAVFLDNVTSPHFVVPPSEMLVHMSRVCEVYGLNFSIWYPSASIKYDPDYHFIRRIPKLNALFIPGGDPGDLDPAPMFKVAKNIISNVRKYHPHCQLWISSQGFNATQMTQFYSIIQSDMRNMVTWLTGIVYGPHTRDTVQQARISIPSIFPIRYYPDICHSLKSQFPNPHWGPAAGLIEQREVITPRPVAHTLIIKQELPSTIGFVSYSDGVVDDINKFFWSTMGWNTSIETFEVLEDYANTLIDASLAATIAPGILRLETNWLNPSLKEVEATLSFFEKVLQTAGAVPPRVRKDWRWSSLVFRAYLDVYVLKRYEFEQQTEKQALQTLESYRTDGATRALTSTLELLSSRSQLIVDSRIRLKLEELAMSLFTTINLELSTSNSFQNIGAGRGAVLDFLENPLSNRLWLTQELSNILINSTFESEKVHRIKQILSRTDPGPGGFYDDLGSGTNEPHLVRSTKWQTDPSFYRGSVDTTWEPFFMPNVPIVPFQSYYYAEAYYDQPVQLFYPKVDQNVSYRVKVVYSGDTGQSVRLVAQKDVLIHDYLVKPYPPSPLSFRVPKIATAQGTLLLSFYGPVGQGGSGRAQQVAEVWLQVDA